MVTMTKRRKAHNAAVELEKVYQPIDALEILKKLATAKFDESIDVSVMLGVDPRKSDQVVRRSTVLPNGTGKTVRVAVFAEGDAAAKAEAAGADTVGYEDLADRMKGGELDYDVVIATPAAMRVVGRLGQVLGPRGLMPNPKVGTVSADVAAAVKNAKGGQVRYRTDKNGIIHSMVGKASFTAQALQENIVALLQDLKKAKPSSAKGIYFKKLTLSSTMGPGVVVDLSALIK